MGIRWRTQPLRGMEMDDGETVVGDLVMVPEGLDPERHHRPLLFMQLEPSVDARVDTRLVWPLELGFQRLDLVARGVLWVWPDLGLDHPGAVVEGIDQRVLGRGPLPGGDAGDDPDLG